MRYYSIFSGIEAASVAWGPLGWEPLLFSEIDEFPSAVLKARFPSVPNLGDITKINWKEAVRDFGRPDIVVGGSPCQSFSIAGGRTGLEGASGLMWEYVRCVREVKPDWLLWENVPGALSSSHGEDFQCLLEALDACGYGLAWRVLDAQFFGLAQRRERVFVVGRLGDVERPCEILFEPESLSWDTPSSREKRQELASGAGGCAEAAGFRWNAGGKTALSVGETSPTVVSSDPPAVCAGFKFHQGAGAGSIGYEPDQSPTLTADYHNPAVLCIPENAINRPNGGTNGPMAYGPQEPSPTLRASKDVPAVLDLTGGEAQASRVYSSDGIAPSLRAHESGGNDLKVLCMAGQQPNSMVSDEVCGTLTAHEARGGVDRMRDAIGFAANVRRLTPRECERLQGFPSVVELEVEKMTSDELIACALANGDIFCDFDTGEVYGTRGPGGINLKEPKKLGFKHPSGYVHVSLHAGGEKKQVRAHRIVYMAAYGEIPDGMVIDHVNNDKSDNRLSNLQMMTPEGNSRKAAMEDRYLSGEENPRCKIGAEVRTKMMHDYSEHGMTYRDIARKYGVSKSRVGQIAHEDDWTKVPYRSKPAEECPDTPRYKAIGNSMAVPVMRWLGQRIEMVEGREYK